VTAGTALREILDFLLPTRCLGCDDRLPLDGPAQPVCVTCLARLRPPPWPRCPRCHYPNGTGRLAPTCLACHDWPAALRGARSAVILEDRAGRLVHALKYEGWRELAPLMADRMRDLPLPDAALAGRAVVVPIPTTSRRRRQRGYNQAALLASAYARGADLQFVEALVRNAGGGSQVSLHPAQRQSNVRGAFSMAPSSSGSISGRQVVLVDDVLTTGATAGEAAATLERAGAEGVSLVTFARALPERRRDLTGAIA